MDYIDVLVVEDDPMVADIHQNYVNSVDGFRVVGMVDNGLKALDFLRKRPVRLVILDIFLPGLDGLGTLERIRESGSNVDVIIISASRDKATVNKTLQAGAFDYIVKPFAFDRMKAALQAFRQVVHRLTEGPNQVDQQDIDNLLLARNKKNVQTVLPKGLNPNVLEKVEALLTKVDKPLSSVETADAIGVSRITARRYLEYLVASDKAVMEREYQEVGRPINKYELIR
ncbi:response regulator [Dethiosulfovibrio sp. F2B]|uniref:response regulator n=1 Tax=Dethiosulfovibrio faecalis TaxID=2720018 RepID=UPI001F185703|nr:response regulator [Dethiosulfovibrio faecalis]MCF4151678.1 response regulator [Dethiosulfovibrio faecalis]